MITHALIILQKELEAHLIEVYGPINLKKVILGNMAEGINSGSTAGMIDRDKLVFTVVNIKEEKALKNLPAYVRNDSALSVSYENPPVFVNLLLLVTATHTLYDNATLDLSRTIRYFQHKNVFTPDTVAPTSMDISSPVTEHDQLETFKLILDLYSPSLEEVNHLWGTLGGKQYPFVLYMLRMLDLKYKAVTKKSGLITEVFSDFYHKNGRN
jgi:hypothetical protein